LLASLIPAQWREPKFDLGELARLRFIEGYDQHALARHFEKSVFAIRYYYVTLRRTPLSKLRLSKKEQEQIKWKLSSTKLSH